MENSFSQALSISLENFYSGAIRFLPGLAAMMVIVLTGLVVGWILNVIVRRALGLAKFDRFCANAGAAQILTRADIRVSPSNLAGRFVFWLVFLVAVMTGVSALQLDVFDRLIAEFFLYLPRIFAALLILLVGFLIGNFLSRASLLAAVNANMPSARLVSSGVKVLIAILTFAMALEQLQIARGIVTSAFTIAFGAVMLGLAVAFGLGGQQVARRLLEERFPEKKQEQPDQFSHI
jgi:hypothetical protein